MHKLAGNVYVDTSFPGVTVGAVITKAGIVCIDTPTRPSDARAWRERLATFSPKPIRWMINTDHHRDRVLGNQWFDAPVIAHEWSGERLRLYPEIIKSSGLDTSSDYDLLRELSGVRVVPPQITFSHELTLLEGEANIVIRHMAGQSPGAVWVLLPETGVVFTGDTVVLDAHPPLAEADFPVWQANLEELNNAHSPLKTIIPGRGKPGPKTIMKYTQHYLKVARRLLDSALKTNRGRADAATVAAELLKQFPVHDSQRDAVARRVRAEVERWCDAQHGAAD
jgi:glyoxylase-like metal-dependent hydrolase (beta-lactamase superfamily II)